MQDTIIPDSMQWSISISGELPWHALLQVTYVGTQGLQLSREDEGGLSLNQVPSDVPSKNRCSAAGFW